MKKYKNVLLVFIAFAIVIVGVFYLSKLGEDKYFKEISYNKYTTSTKDFVVYIGSKEDEETFNFMKDYSSSNNIEMNYIYTENLTEEQKEELLGDKTYALITTSDKEKTIYDGKLYNAFITDHLMNNGLLKKAYIKINIDDFKELKQTENFVVVIGKTGCHYCEEYQPVLTEVAKEQDMNIYYIDLTTLSDSDYDYLYTSSPYLSNEDWGTPTTLIFSNDKEVNYLSGFVSNEELTAFLKDNKVIK